MVEESKNPDVLAAIEQQDAEILREKGRPVQNAKHHFTDGKNKKHDDRLKANGTFKYERGSAEDFRNYCKKAHYDVNAAKHLYLRGMPTKQIAKQLGIGDDTIRMTVHRFGWHHERRQIDAVAMEVSKQARTSNTRAIEHALNIGKTEGGNQKLEELLRRIDATNLSRTKMLVDKMMGNLEASPDPDPAKAEKLLNVMLKQQQLQAEVLKNPGKMASADDAGVPEKVIDEKAEEELMRKAQAALDRRKQLENS